MTDQSAKPGDSYQKFFGSSCATYFQYARLLARARPEVVFIACLREGFSFRFRLQGRDLTPALEGPGDENERAQNLIGAYLATLEELIRAHPEQYLWMHRRWKYRPPGAPDLYQRLREPLELGLLEPVFPREEAGAPEVS
jgi:KDO2-lipid IV(A) lauroyltransferase